MTNMTTLKESLSTILGEIEEDSDSNRKQARIMQVRNCYREVVKAAYPTNYQLVLNHTNSVYIMMKEEVKTLIVYVDESIFAAELNARRELMKLMFMKMFGEQIEQFDIYVSRGKYKKQHPFVVEEEQDLQPARQPLDEQQRQYVKDTVDVVENPRVKAALEKAMTANLESKDQ